MRFGGVPVKTVYFGGTPVTAFNFEPTNAELKKYFEAACKKMPPDDISHLVSVSVTKNFYYGREDFVEADYTVHKTLGVINT